MKRIIKFTIAAALIIILLISVSAVTTTTPFADVPSGAWYSEAVAWAYECGITNGTSATTFEPDRPITRAEAVTMLWRMNGSPEPTPEPTPTPKPTPTPTPIVFGNVGRLYVHGHSVPLNSPLTQEVVDPVYSCGYYDGWGNTVIGDHCDQGFDIIGNCVPGETCYILHEDGSREEYVCVRVDLNGTNTGGDVLDSNGESAFDDPDSDMFMYTCAGTGDWHQIWVVYWKLVDGIGAEVEFVIPRVIPSCGEG